jgi:hypothetical protein
MAAATTDNAAVARSLVFILLPRKEGFGVALRPLPAAGDTYMSVAIKSYRLQQRHVG